MALTVAVDPMVVGNNQCRHHFRRSQAQCGNTEYHSQGGARLSESRRCNCCHLKSSPEFVTAKAARTFTEKVEYSRVETGNLATDGTRMKPSAAFGRSQIHFVSFVVFVVPLC